jgi:hypothetical protein
MALLRRDMDQGVEVPHQPYLVGEPEQVEEVAMVSSSSSTLQSDNDRDVLK